MSMTAAVQPALGEEELRRLDAYWRAANYLSVGQIYLLDNPLLREPLRAGARQAAAARALGHHAGPQPRLRAPQPRHPRARPRRHLHPGAGPRRAGARRERLPRGHLHRGLPRHPPRRGGHAARCSGSSRSPAASRATSPRRRPGSIHEGGELGYALAHAYGAAFDNPDLLVALRRRRRRGRDRAARRELAQQQVPQPGARRRRAADPAPQRLQDRQPDGARAHPGDGARQLLQGYGCDPHLVEGDEPDAVHQELAAALDGLLDDIARDPARGARRAAARDAPALADDRAAHAEGVDRAEGRRRLPVEGTCRAHQVPLPACATTRSTCGMLEEWMRSYRPEELFDAEGRLVEELAALPPTGDAAHERQPARQRRPAAAPPRPARLPRLRRRRWSTPAAPSGEATRVLGDVPARRDRGEPSDELPRCSAPTRPPRTARRVFEVTTGRGWARSLPDRRGPRARTAA